MSETLDRFLSPARLKGLELRNRVIKAATFEGKCPGGTPSQALIDFHRRIAEGGTALTTVAYCAVAPDGRINPNTMYMHEGIRAQLEQLAKAVHDAGGKLSGQMGHCGGFTKTKTIESKRPLGPSFGFNTLGAAAGMPFVSAMKPADMDRMVAHFGRAGAFMKSAGFDAVEIHFGHGYGLSQFISPKTNRRSDEYGGSLENRMRLPLRVLAAVREAVGDDFPILGKISMSDGVAGGIEIDDAIEVAALLDRGGIDAIIPSSGTSSMNPMLLFRGDSLGEGMIENEPNPLVRLGLRLMGKRLFKSYPYHELYFLDDAKRIRDRIEASLCYIGGVSTHESLEVVAKEFDFVQLGRALVKDPDLPKRIANPKYVNGCTHCNRCATLIEAPGGIRCVLTEPNAPD